MDPDPDSDPQQCFISTNARETGEKVFCGKTREILADLSPPVTLLRRVGFVAVNMG